jgi:hypothetical protein
MIPGSGSRLMPFHIARRDTGQPAVTQHAHNQRVNIANTAHRAVERLVSDEILNNVDHVIRQLQIIVPGVPTGLPQLVMKTVQGTVHDFIVFEPA